MLGDTLLYIKYGENDIGKDKTAVKCLSPPLFEKKIIEDKTASECLNPPLSKDQSFNFAINNELKECNEYRLKHLNEEEKENLKRVLFTSTIKHPIQTKHEDPVYRKPYKYSQTL